MRDGEGIWGTDFVFERVLQEAEHRPHSMSIVHRSGYTQPEIHEFKWDMYVILDGTGIVRMGGERVGWKEGLPPERKNFRHWYMTAQRDRFEDYNYGLRIVFRLR